MSTRNKSRFAAAAAVGVGALAFAVAGSSAAIADPGSPFPAADPADYVAVGSDTVQDLYNEFQNGHAIDSYNAFPNGTITVNGVTLERPHGSGDGVEALSASWNPASNKYNSSSVAGDYFLGQGASATVDIARSSSRPSSAFTAPSFAAANLVYVPLARDAVSVLTKGIGVTNLQTGALTRLYDNSGLGFDLGAGDITGEVRKPSSTVVQLFDGSAWQTVTPLIPQSASGTRSFFLSAIGVSAVGPQVVDRGNTIPENDASVLLANGELIPFSAAQYIAQHNGFGVDTFAGTSGLGFLRLNGLAPVGEDDGFYFPSFLFGDESAPVSPGVGTFARDVYSVVVKAAVETAGAANPTATTLGSLVTTDLPGDSAVIDFGFLPISYSATAGNWLFATWTNPALP